MIPSVPAAQNKAYGDAPANMDITLNKTFSTL
jgi:hypothetical protein